MIFLRKKPVVVSAVQWDGTNGDEIKEWVGFNSHTNESRFLLANEISQMGGAVLAPHIYDEEQNSWVKVQEGDYIIRGVRGEFYPCSERVVNETYELVTA